MNRKNNTMKLHVGVFCGIGIFKPESGNPEKTLKSLVSFSTMIQISYRNTTQSYRDMMYPLNI